MKMHYTLSVEADNVQSAQNLAMARWDETEADASDIKILIIELVK